MADRARRGLWELTAGLNGQLDQVDMDVGRADSPGALTVQIRAVDGSGTPTSTVLASATVAQDDIPQEHGWIQVPLSPPAASVAGTQYAIVLGAPDSSGCGIGGNGCYSWSRSQCDTFACVSPYAAGSPFFSDNGGASWMLLDPDGDHAFKTYVTPAAFGFGGFAQPIDNGVVNSAKAGQSIPVKWQLQTAGGTPVSDPASFVSLTSQVPAARAPGCHWTRSRPTSAVRACSTSPRATGSSTGRRPRATAASAER